MCNWQRRVLFVSIAIITMMLVNLFTNKSAPHVAVIEDTYGITLTVGDIWGVYDNNADLTRHLAVMDTALDYVGTDFIHELDAAYDGGFSFNLIPTVSGDARAHFSLENTIAKIVLTGSNQSPINKYQVLHELGHAVYFAAQRTDEVPEPFSVEVYAGVLSETSLSEYPDRFHDVYSETSPKEDFAQCFYYAVLNGGDNPLKYDLTTPIYQKTLKVYNDLLALAGHESKATQRVAAYLGIK